VRCTEDFSQLAQFPQVIRQSALYVPALQAPNILRRRQVERRSQPSEFLRAVRRRNWCWHSGIQALQGEGISWHHRAQKFDMKCWQCMQRDVQGSHFIHAIPFTLATFADLREQLAGLAIEAGLEADAKVVLVHALHLGLFVRTPIN
jgi:hypothetical protein